jgi:methionyl aminopeptidase
MSIHTMEELRALLRVGAVVSQALRAMQRAIEPGITTAEIDAVAADVLAAAGARATPQHTYGFPGTACISVNDELVHGVPGPRRVERGDIVKIDVTADLDGFVADAARTVVVPPVNRELVALAECAQAAFSRALEYAVAGRTARQVGKAVETEVRRRGFAVHRGLCGHGVGRAIHEEPSIPNYDDPRSRARLTDGLVITIEPIVSSGTGKNHDDADGWTVRTTDGTPGAHFEQSLVITQGRPIILTAA